MVEQQAVKQKDLIYDVGMHQGEDTRTYLDKGFRVVAFEADPDLVKQCQQLFAAEIAAGRLTIVEGAIISDSSQSTVTFYKNPVATIWGTIDPAWAARNERMGWASEEVTVDVVDFKKCLIDFGVPRYIKIDIEGADMVCLAKLAEVEVRPDYVSVESDKKSIEGIRAELDLLTSLGYDAFKAVQQGTIQNQPIPEPPLEGTARVTNIPHGSSGLFGRELPDQWASYAGIMGRYRWIMLAYKIFGNDSFVRSNRITRKIWRLLQRKTGRPIPGWFDTHARHATVQDV
jgi:FkbM family methyltransferase